MSEHTNDFTNYEPNFILKPAAGDSADAKADDSTGTVAAKTDVKVDETTNAKAGDPTGAKAMRNAFENTTAAATYSGNATAETAKPADSSHSSAANTVKPADNSDSTAANTVKPADSSAGSSNINGGETPAGRSSEAPRPKESPAAEVLRAAAARADALKAAASKIDGSSDPYRRETSEISEAEMDSRIHSGGFQPSQAKETDIPDAYRAEAAATRGSSASHGPESSGDSSGYGTNGFSSGSTGASSFGSTGASGFGSTSRTGSSGASGFGSSGNSGSGGFGSSGNSGSGASGFGSSGNSGSGASGFGSSGNSGSTGFNSGLSGSSGYGSGGHSAGRPTYENPSFDPGQTGRFTDPRDSFRGESASWSNGEVHQNRRQMKDSINRHAKQKKAPKPVTLSRRALGLLIAGCLCLSCLFGLGGAALGTTLVKQNLTNTAQSTATTTASSSDSGDSTAASAGYTLEKATGSNMTIKEITAATKGSVVEIRTESVSSDTWMQQYVTQGAGSGVIISDDGYIMTNNHVIEGASKIKVTTADEKEYEAELIGADETNDVAVLKVDATGLTPATYGNSDQLEVGDLAVAIGNPLGELGGTVTAGIVSATDRELAIDGKTLHLLQTDSSINPGNSGGGLFNGDGQLIGLVVAKSSGSDVEGLGFAIPINTAANVAQQLIDKGYVSGQPSTGMTYQTGTSGSGNGSDPFSNFDSFFGNGASAGVYIYSVNGENAKKAGFQAGDLVYAVDGEQITSFDDLTTVITSHEVGDKVTFTIVRDGVQKNIKLKLEEKTAASQEPSSQPEQEQQNGQMPDGQTGPDGQEGQQDQTLPGDEGGMGGWQEFFNQFF